MTSFPSRCWGQLKIACSLQCSADTTSQRSNRNNDPVATAAGNLPRFNAGCSSLFKRRSHGTYWEMTHTTNMCVLKFFLFRVYNLHEESPWPFKCFFTLNMKRFFCSVSSHLQKKKRKEKEFRNGFCFVFTIKGVQTNEEFQKSLKVLFQANGIFLFYNLELWPKAINISMWFWPIANVNRIPGVWVLQDLPSERWPLRSSCSFHGFQPSTSPLTQGPGSLTGALLFMGNGMFCKVI